MGRRNTILLVLAVVIALATALAVKSRMAPPPETQAAPAATRVLVVQHDISPGGFVHAADLGWQAWPADAVQPNYVREGSEQISSYEGAVARLPMKTGEPVISDMLIKPGAGGFLSAVLEPGKRAVSVAVTPTSGAAGFIFPGDRVDLIVTHKVGYKESDQEQDQAIVSETFVTDVRVVAVDQQLDNPDNKAILAKTITVEVTAKEAERVAVAEQMGSISFALRSLASAAPKATQGGEDDPLIHALESGKSGSADMDYTRDNEISPVLDHSGEAMPHVLIIRGDQHERRAFYESAP